MRVIVVGSHTNPVISTHFAVDGWASGPFPVMFLQIENCYGHRTRIHFADPDALDQVAAALRTLQDHYRTYLQTRGAPLSLTSR